MSTVRACLVLAFAFALSTPFSGCDNGGTGGAGSGGSGSGGHGTGGTGTGGTTGCGLGTGGDPTVPQCLKCLDTKCATQKASCDADCYAVQGCIDAVCAHLSEIGSTEEGACQTYCQTLHGAGKAAHLSFASCAATAACEPPCAGAPYDYEQCAMTETAGCCKGAADACAASTDCVMYQACASSCATASDCEKCASDMSAGEKLFEALQLCIGKTCLSAEWVPHP